MISGSTPETLESTHSKNSEYFAQVFACEGLATLVVVSFEPTVAVVVHGVSIICADIVFNSA
jgi:hypothetical protein